jgi:hypothetical protein
MVHMDSSVSLFLEAAAEDLVMRHESNVAITQYDNPSIWNSRNIWHYNNTRSVGFFERLVHVVGKAACIFFIHKDFLDKPVRVFWSCGFFFCGMTQVWGIERTGLFGIRVI